MEQVSQILEYSEWCVNGWKTYLSRMVLHQNPLFYQHVMQELFESITKEKFKGIKSITCSDIIVPALTYYRCGKCGVLCWRIHCQEYNGAFTFIKRAGNGVDEKPA